MLVWWVVWVGSYHQYRHHNLFILSFRRFVGDGGASWKLRALKRAQERAAASGTSLAQEVHHLNQILYPPWYSLHFSPVYRLICTRSLIRKLPSHSICTLSIRCTTTTALRCSLLSTLAKEPNRGASRTSKSTARATPAAKRATGLWTAHRGATSMGTKTCGQAAAGAKAPPLPQAVNRAVAPASVWVGSRPTAMCSESSGARCVAMHQKMKSRSDYRSLNIQIYLWFVTANYD